MITIQPEIEILSTESYEDMLRRIEKIGRVCYKRSTLFPYTTLFRSLLQERGAHWRRHCREIHRRHHQTRP